jgi:hypothetical protein
MLSEVRREVREATRGRQVPWENSALEGQFVFRATAAAGREALPPARPAPATPDLEALFWDTVRTSRDPAEYRAYLARYPNGNFAELARSRIAQIEPASRPAAPAAIEPAAFHRELLARLAASLPQLSADSREERVRQYERVTGHKAQAVSLQPGGTWRTDRWSSVALAEEATLEGCQVFFGAPCVLMASDEQLSPLPANADQWQRRDRSSWDGSVPRNSGGLAASRSASMVSMMAPCACAAIGQITSSTSRISCVIGSARNGAATGPPARCGHK